MELTSIQDTRAATVPERIEALAAKSVVMIMQTPANTVTMVMRIKVKKVVKVVSVETVTFTIALATGPKAKALTAKTVTMHTAAPMTTMVMPRVHPEKPRPR
jgi:hypothetical protein